MCNKTGNYFPLATLYINLFYQRILIREHLMNKSVGILFQFSDNEMSHFKTCQIP